MCVCVRVSIWLLNLIECKLNVAQVKPHTEKETEFNCITRNSIFSYILFRAQNEMLIACEAATAIPQRQPQMVRENQVTP